MAEGQTLTEEIAQIKIHTGIVGVIFLIVGLKLVACGLAAMILHDLTFQYTMYSMGLILAGFAIGFWALYSSVCYLAISYKGKGKENQLYLRMVGLMMQWSIFMCLVHIGTVAILGVSLNTGSDADNRLRAITITCIVGCGISGVFTFFGLFSLVKCMGKLGLPLEPPKKRFVLTAFKGHGFVLLIISVHQIVWALVALIVPQFGGREYPVRIAAFSVGGIVNPILATVTAFLCFKLVRYANNPKEKQRIMTKTMVEVHKAWIWAFIGINIAGSALYGVSVGTRQEEHGNWTVTAPCYVVIGHVLSLIGNVLIGYLYFAVAHYEQFQDALGLSSSVKPKSTQQASTSNNTGNGSGAAAAKQKTTAKPGAPKSAPKKPTTKAKVTEASGSTSNTNTPASSGATATSSGTNQPSTSAQISHGDATPIDELVERNRLLQEEVALQKQLNELRQQQLPASPQTVLYTGNTVHLGPSAPPCMPPIYTVNPEDSAPPSYEDVASYPDTKHD